LLEAIEDKVPSEKIQIIPGGNTRHSSTLHGLESVKAFSKPDDPVLIHDVARPILIQAELESLISKIKTSQSVVSLVSRISDTIVAASSLPGRLEKRLDRDKLFAVKTPQGAPFKILEDLSKIPESLDFTDLLTWAEAGGIQGELTESSPYNHKVTYPGDIPLFEFYLSLTGMKSTT